MSSPLSSSFPLANRRVLLTGATGGLGRAFARTLADAGARLALHYRRDDEGAARLLAELPGGSSRHATLRSDLSEPAAADDLISRAVDALGDLDVLVNNAGIYEEIEVADSTPDDWQKVWDRTMRVNLDAPARLAYRFARHRIERGGEGTVVQISSRGAFRGEPTAMAYGASKAGLNAFGQSLAQALAPWNIGVFTLAPGFVETPMAAALLAGPRGDEIRTQSPFGRVAKPEDVAHWVLACAAPEALFASGSIIDVNGASYLRS